MCCACPTPMRRPSRSGCSASPGVRDAYADRVASVSWAPNDPRAPEQWGVWRIQAPTAWASAQGQGVLAAVLDCGVHASHPDLAGKVVAAQNFSAATTTGRWL